MKKGYHDYVPVVEPEVKEEKKKEKGTYEPKYITSEGGLKFMISDEKGMVVANTDVLQFGNRCPSISYVRPYNVDLKMDTKNYIKYNGRI
jgi:hypothetical protein